MRQLWTKSHTFLTSGSDRGVFSQGLGADATAVSRVVEDELGAPEERERFPELIADRCVPHLRRSPAVDSHRLAVDGSLPRRPEKVRLQLDGREPGAAVRQRRKAAVAARSVGEGDDRARVEKTVRREQVGAHRQSQHNSSVLDQHDVDAQQPGQRARGHRLKIRGVYFRGWDETYFATLTI